MSNPGSTLQSQFDQGELHMITERVDDIVLLIGQMIKMNLPGIIDQHIPRQGPQAHLIWGRQEEEDRLTSKLAIYPPGIPPPVSPYPRHTAGSSACNQGCLLVWIASQQRLVTGLLKVMIVSQCPAEMALLHDEKRDAIGQRPFLVTTFTM